VRDGGAWRLPRLGAPGGPARLRVPPPSAPRRQPGPARRGADRRRPCLPGLSSRPGNGKRCPAPGSVADTDDIVDYVRVLSCKQAGPAPCGLTNFLNLEGDDVMTAAFLRWPSDFVADTRQDAPCAVPRRGLKRQVLEELAVVFGV